MSQLLPCPFCGRTNPLFGRVRDGAEVCCSDLSCLARVMAFNPNAREKVIRRWNTRLGVTPSTTLLQETER